MSGRDDNAPGGIAAPLGGCAGIGLSPPPAAREDPPWLGQQRVGLLSLVPGLLADHGVAPEQAVRAAGLTLDDLSDPGNAIPFAAMGRLFAAARALTGREEIGILLGERGGLQPTLGLVGDLMRHAPTLGIALEDLATNQRRYVSGAVVYLLRSGRGAFLGYAVHRQSVQALAQISDAALAVGAKMLRELGAGAPVEVLLSRRPPEDPSAWQRVFGVPVRFDAPQSALVLDRAQLDQPIPGADPAARAMLERQVADYWAVSPPDIVAEVTRLLLPHIPWGEDSLLFAAGRLGMHPRTLERRLQRAGTSFRALQNALRLEVAGQLLRGTRMSVAAIGAALGYGDPSAFGHWFRRAAGETPARWREQPGPMSVAASVARGP